MRYYGQIIESYLYDRHPWVTVWDLQRNACWVALVSKSPVFAPGQLVTFIEDGKYAQDLQLISKDELPVGTNPLMAPTFDEDSFLRAIELPVKAFNDGSLAPDDTHELNMLEIAVRAAEVYIQDRDNDPHAPRLDKDFRQRVASGRSRLDELRACL